MENNTKKRMDKADKLVMERITALLEGTTFTWCDVEKQVKTMVSTDMTNMNKTSLQIRKERNEKIVSLWHEVSESAEYSTESKSSKVEVVTNRLNELGIYKERCSMGVKKILATYGVAEFSNYKAQLKKENYGK